jgi:hypothetical protein
MTRSQFAMAVMADEKWVENAGRLLGRQFRYTPAEARWLGLVHILNQEVGVTLSRAAQLASEALRNDAKEGSVVLGRTARGSVGVSVDLGRFHSAYAAALSAAIDLGGSRRRGRRRPGLEGKTGALERAANYGVDIDLLREGLRLSRRERLERVDTNAAFARAIRPVAGPSSASRHKIP